MDEQTLYAARDPQGFRPLVLGRLARGWVIASETAALDIVGAAFMREVEPGELLTIDEAGVGPGGSLPPTRKDACSSTCTWRGLTPRSPVAACTRPGWKSDGGWQASIQRTRTW